MSYTSAINDVERLICQRFNVSEIDGELAEGLRLARSRARNLDPLEAAIARREMYRWQDAIAAALSEAREALSEAEAEEPVEESVVEADPDSEIPGVVEERPDDADPGERIEDTRGRRRS